MKISTKSMRHAYKWRPDIADPRDRLYLKQAPLPKFVNKLGARNQIENQGDLGSCTGNSSTSMLEITMGLNVQLSRLMAYYNARSYDGTINEDAGAYIRSVIKGLMKIGVSSEAVWPYKVKKFKTKPSDKAYADARALVERLSTYEYARVSNLTQLKTALSQGFPVTFGFSVPESFERMGKDCFLALPGSDEEMLGGHAVVAVGYDDRPKKPFVWVRNSWGEEWGLSGYFKMDQHWFTDSRKLADDLWVIRPKTK